MALTSMGTSATTTLRGLHMDGNLSVADAATLRANIKWDGVYANAAWVRVQNGIAYPGAFEFQGGQGLLHLPQGRGSVKVYPGDYVAYDPNGWPIVIAGWSISGSGASGWSGPSAGTP
jgi:hypothetical protein